MRIARTLQDVSELLSDYEVELNLMDDYKIDFVFPSTQKEKQHKEYIEENGEIRSDNFSHIPKDDPIYFRRKTVYTIRNLVSSPRFWRLTTVADQLSRFCICYQKNQEQPYGNIKVSKKKNENLCMVFENMDYANRFMNDLEKIGAFQKA